MIDRRIGRVVKFDGIVERIIGVAQDFVDDHAVDRSDARRAGRSAVLAAGAPVDWIVVIAGGVYGFERSSPCHRRGRANAPLSS